MGFLKWVLPLLVLALLNVGGLHYMAYVMEVKASVIDLVVILVIFNLAGVLYESLSKSLQVK